MSGADGIELYKYKRFVAVAERPGREGTPFPEAGRSANGTAKSVTDRV